MVRYLLTSLFSYILYSIVHIVHVSANSWTVHKNHPQSNLLFIMFDDLRPELSIYGRKHMLTPNFERLAAKSVVFDRAFTAIAVCNPSRDSLLTGLRPDTVGTYGFQHSYDPHMTLPRQLVKSGYITAGYGKIRHYDGPDSSIWSEDQWEGGWYDYQAAEWAFLNSSVTPDKVRPIEQFRDHILTTEAVKGLHKMAGKYKDSLQQQQQESGSTTEKANKIQHFMVAVGFKLPHVTLHIPYEYYALYRNTSWDMTDAQLQYPRTAPAAGYRCCAEAEFRYMEEEGSVASNKRTSNLWNMNKVFPHDAYNEMMRGYCGAVSFVDAQLGRLLDVMDKEGLWESTTVVLTSDHGMHNGEKGMYEKWTLFDEAGRVPLLIHHPLSPFAGQHYRYPVELIDIYPTVLDLLQAPTDTNHAKPCPIVSDCTSLQGKSLAPIVLGERWKTALKKLPTRQLNRRILQETNSATDHTPRHHGRHHSHLRTPHSGLQPLPHNYTHANEIRFVHDFSLTQFWRCLEKENIHKIHPVSGQSRDQSGVVFALFNDCSMDPAKDFQGLMLMGYSMRTMEYRYTAWLYFNPVTLQPIWSADDSPNDGTPASISSSSVANILYDANKDNKEVQWPTSRDFSIGSSGHRVLMPAFEELYDHRPALPRHHKPAGAAGAAGTAENGDSAGVTSPSGGTALHQLADHELQGLQFTKLEVVNLANERTRYPPPQPHSTPAQLSEAEQAEDEIRATIESYRRRLLNYLQRHVIYSGRH